MEYKYNLAKLQDDKEDIEQLITRQSQRVGPVFPQNLEQEFWTKNLERARKHVEKYVGWSTSLFPFFGGDDSHRLLEHQQRIFRT